MQNKDAFTYRISESRLEEAASKMYEGVQVEKLFMKKESELGLLPACAQQQEKFTPFDVLPDERRF